MEWTIKYPTVSVGVGLNSICYKDLETAFSFIISIFISITSACSGLGLISGTSISGIIGEFTDAVVTTLVVVVVLVVVVAFVLVL